MNTTPVNPALPEPAHGQLMPITKQPRPVPDYDRRDLILAGGAVVAGYLCVRLVLFGGLGLGAAVALAAVLGLAVWVLLPRGKAIPREGRLFLCLAAALLSHFALIDNNVLKRLALPGFVLVLGYAAVILGGGRIEDRIGPFLPLELGDALGLTPFLRFAEGPHILLHDISKAKRGKSLLLLLAGGLMALPLFAVVASNLIAADAVFAGLWERFRLHILAGLWTLSFQLILAFPLACYLFALLFGAKRAKGPRYDAERAGCIANLLRILPTAMALGAVLPILALYAAFFFSQTAYFLSAFRGLLPHGIFLVSEYARNGFFELCTVSAINLTLIAGMQLLCREGPRLRRWLTLLLSLCSLGMIAIAMSKMFLYIRLYGLTPKRLYTSWFMLFLAEVFGLILAWLAKPSLNPVRGIVLTGTAMFLILCLANPGRMIADYNVNAYRNGRIPDLDISIVQAQDASATAVLIEASQMEELLHSHRHRIEELLRERLMYYRDLSWTQQSLATFQARRLLEDWWAERTTAQGEGAEMIGAAMKWHLQFD